MNCSTWHRDRGHGRRFLDAYNNVVPAGHCHPRIMAAIVAHTERLNTHTRDLHDTIVDYADALLVVDTIFSSDGIFSDPAGFLTPAVDAIHKAGGYPQRHGGAALEVALADAG